MLLFGAALNSSFIEQSDVNLLVKFKAYDLSKYFDNYMDLKEILENLFVRKVDLVEDQTLRPKLLLL
jgi:predicted nucleotidyltransferase